MLDNLEKVVTALADKAKAAQDSGDAQRYTQAACNIANAARVLADMSDWPTKDAAPSKSVSESQIEYMVDRFLTWRLPENFNPDGGIIFKKIANEGTAYAYRFNPTGTNLFDVGQAEAMVRHMLENLPTA